MQLGTTGTVSGFDIDTANFNGVPTILLHYNQLNCVYSPSGNEAPEVSVYALYDAEMKAPPHDDPRVRCYRTLMKLSEV
jgi:allantoicase